jgi:hypothetical protein
MGLPNHAMHNGRNHWTNIGREEENRIKNEVASKLHEEWDNEDKNKSQSAQE